MSLMKSLSRAPVFIGYEPFRLAFVRRNQRVCLSSIFCRTYVNPKPIEKEIEKKDKAELLENHKFSPKIGEAQSEQKSELPRELKTEPEVTKISVKEKLNPKTVRQNVEGYVNTRYFDYLAGYNSVLEKNFPSAVKVYRIFVDGFKDFYNDMKRYLKISKIANESPKGMKALNRKELELFMQMPRDMFKVAPALICCSLPMVGYAAMALVFMYPSTFLTSHFWTLQQKIQFRDATLKYRLSFNRDVLRCLQAKTELIKNPDEKCKLENILGMLGSGFHPSVEQILDAKEAFVNPPFNILNLSNKHIKLLTRMHGVPTGLFKRFRLREHAYLIHYMDLAILKEGDVHNMPQESIKHSCFIRGLNPANLTNEEMIEWLRNWVKVSTSIEAPHLSLFLHLPLLLAYNHPNNWKLIYGEKQK